MLPRGKWRKPWAQLASLWPLSFSLSHHCRDGKKHQAISLLYETEAYRYCNRCSTRRKDFRNVCTYVFCVSLLLWQSLNGRLVPFPLYTHIHTQTYRLTSRATVRHNMCTITSTRQFVCPCMLISHFSVVLGKLRSIRNMFCMLGYHP